MVSRQTPQFQVPPDDPPTPAWPVGLVIDGAKYVSESIILGTFSLTAAELQDLAFHEPIAIRAVTDRGQVCYCWTDLMTVTSFMTLLDWGETAAADDAIDGSPRAGNGGSGR